MISVSLRFLTLIFFALPSFLEAREFVVPPIRDHVNDSGNVLSSQVERQLNQFLASVKSQTGIEMAVLTVETIGDTPLEEASLQVVEAWKLGSAQEDKGLLLFLSIQDRKLRFEVGQGLEGSLTDLYASRIIRDTMVPALKSGDYNQAVLLGVDEAIGRVAPELSSTQEPRSRKKKGSLLGTLIWVVLFFIFSFGGLGRRRGRRGFGSVLDSGGFGGFGRGGGFGGSGFGGGGGFSGGGASGGW